MAARQGLHIPGKREGSIHHLISIHRIMGISLQDKVTNADVLSRVGLSSMYTCLDKKLTQTAMPG